MKAVIYRYSAAENPTWLDQQEADCRRYADEHDLTVTEVFTAVGRVGTVCKTCSMPSSGRT